MSVEVGHYPRTWHLEGSGDPASGKGRDRLRWGDFAGRTVVLEEKVDGTHSGFFFDGAGTLHAMSRGGGIDLGRRNGPERQFDLFKDWLAENEDALLGRLEDRYVVYGEWAYAAHSVFYDCLPHPFLEFDVFDQQEEAFLSTARRRELLDGSGIQSVPVLYEGPAGAHPSTFVGPSLFKSSDWRVSLETALSRTGLSMSVASRFEDSALSEGIYGKVEEDGEVVMRFKWIRPGFVSHVIGSGKHWSRAPMVRNGVRSTLLAETIPSWD